MSALGSAILGALIGAVIVGLAWLASLEHQRRMATDRRLAEIEQQLANVGRAKNRLYRERLEDVGFAASQAALRVHALRAHLEEQLAVVESILNRKDTAPQ